MARFRLLLIGLTIWLVILFNLERPDIQDFGNIDLDSFVYVIAAMVAVTILALPDLGRRSEYVLIPTLILYAIAKVTIGHPDTPLPLIITEIVVLILTVSVARVVSLATANIEKAIENVLLTPEKSSVLPEAEGEEKINNELFRARRFDRPVGFVALRIEWLKEMQEHIADRFNLEAAFQKRYLKICLPETDRDQAIRLARQIHMLLKMRLGLDIAVGVAAFPEDGLIYRDLLDHAILNPIAMQIEEQQRPPQDGTGSERAISAESSTVSQAAADSSARRAASAIRPAPLIKRLLQPLPTDYADQPRLKLAEGQHPNDPDFWVNELPYQSASARLVYTILKRLIDIAIVVASAPVTVPLMLVLMLLVFLDGGRPIFFVQQRTGLGGRRFNMYKFRTMVPDAEAKLKELAAQGLAKLGPDGRLAEPLKLDRDPRVTRIGRILRKTSLDELPQIINVLRGDMSLVGPRPTSWGLDSYTLLHTERLTIRPGITGLWQIGARGSTDFDDWLRWDMLYIDKISFALDFQILLRTIGQVLKRQGAR